MDKELKEWIVRMVNRIETLEAKVETLETEAKVKKPTTYGQAWTDTEIEFLKLNYTNSGPAALAEVWEEHCGKKRTEKSISSKAYKLKIKYGLAKQDKEFLASYLKKNNWINKDKAISISEDLGVNTTKMVQYMQDFLHFGTEEDGVTKRNLIEEWNL